MHANHSLKIALQDIESIADTTAEMLLGSPSIYTYSPLHDKYNETFLDANHGPLLLHLALNMYMHTTGYTFVEMKERMKKLLIKALDSYPFTKQEEEIEVKNGVFVVRKNSGLSERQHVLIKMRAAHSESWEVNPRFLYTINYTQSSINFFTYLYSNFFKVNRDIRKHLISSLPNINFPSVLLESYVYIKSQTAGYLHTKHCEQQIENYNSFGETGVSQNFFPSDNGILIDFQLDTRAKNNNTYEALLYLFLAFPICCDDNDTVWETIQYDDMYQVLYQMIYDKEKYKGRLTHEVIVGDLKKAQSILLKGSVEYSSFIKVADKNYENSIVNDILFLMGTNLSREVWEDTKDLPDDWISLL